MTSTAPPDLPALPAGVEYIGQPFPDEKPDSDTGMPVTILKARYRVRGLRVTIGWTVGHRMGNFREPNELQIHFDSSDYGMSATEPGIDDYAPAQAFDGITTNLLRAIPMAHARALMRGRHEQLLVSGLREELSPLPARVETDRDYVHVAMAYVSLVNGSSVEPIRRLGEWTDESVDTWSARLRRARSRGVLLGKGREASIAPAYQAVADELWLELRAQNRSSDGGH